MKILAQKHARYPGIVAVGEEWEDSVNKDDNKLDHLELGEILLPPEVRLHLYRII